MLDAIKKLSIIIPIYNEAALIQRLLVYLCDLISQSAYPIELILVDGGSQDTSQALANEVLQSATVDWQIIKVDPGRAKQMNAGVVNSSGDALLFLHADTQLSDRAFEEINSAINLGRYWGRFDVEFIEASFKMRIVASMMNWRSRQFGIATGDQAMFMSRKLFDLVGGFDDMPLMEDVAMCKKLKLHCLPYCSRLKVRTSARRWLQGGWLKTIILMWYLRFAYFVGVSPQTLAKQYRQVR